MRDTAVFSQALQPHLKTADDAIIPMHTRWPPCQWRVSPTVVVRDNSCAFFLIASCSDILDR
jgi:hypothetical protein